MPLRRLATVLSLLFAFLLPPQIGHAIDLATFAKTPLTIDTKSGTQHFTVEMALTPQQQMQGLMFRQSMAADTGMLFDFKDTAIRSFWMKNTVIPLDMLFIASDGHIADIHERAVPFSEEAIVSNEPVRAVLELNGGTVSRLGIHPGDFVLHSIFGNADKLPADKS